MKSPRIRHIIWLLLLWLMPGSFVVIGTGDAGIHLNDRVFKGIWMKCKLTVAPAFNFEF